MLQRINLITFGIQPGNYALLNTPQWYQVSQDILWLVLLLISDICGVLYHALLL